MLHSTSVGLVYITAVLKTVNHFNDSLNLVAVNVFTCRIDSPQKGVDILGNNSPVGLQLLHSLVLTDLQN